MNKMHIDGKCVVCKTGRIPGPANRVCESPRCQTEYQDWLRLRKPVCAICGVRIEGIELANQTCRSDTCRMKYVVLSRIGKEVSRERCKCCGVYADIIPGSDTWCKDRCCTIVQAFQRRAEENRLHAEQYRNLVARAAGIRDSRANEVQPKAPDSYSIAIVPHTDSQMDDPDQEKVELFRRQMVEMVTISFAESERESDWQRRPSEMLEPASETELPVFSRACASCRGNCCHQGSSHAFISIAIVRRFMSRHPELKPDEVLNAYLDRLPHRSLRDSCVYHTDRGCNLPREMRSDVCNHFICLPLREVREEIARNKRRFFVIPELRGEFFESHFVEVPPGEKLDGVPDEV